MFMNHEPVYRNYNFDKRVVSALFSFGIFDILHLITCSLSDIAEYIRDLLGLFIYGCNC